MGVVLGTEGKGKAHALDSWADPGLPRKRHKHLGLPCGLGLSSNQKIQLLRQPRLSVSSSYTVQES